MNKIDRNKVEKPKCLIENADKWTQDFKQKRKKDKKYWNWHQYKNKNVDTILVEELSKLTNYHCSYCGIFPLQQKVGSRSIDHFKPKSKFEDSAFEWTNLFVACGDCQSLKTDNYPEDIADFQLDSDEYHFGAWFEIEWKTGKIVPQTDKTSFQKQEKAKKIIDWLGLNEGERPKARLNELIKYENSTITDVNEWSFPFFLERANL